MKPKRRKFKTRLSVPNDIWGIEKTDEWIESKLKTYPNAKFKTYKRKLGFISKKPHPNGRLETRLYL